MVFCAPEKRHIVSVFNVIQELLAPSKKKGKNQFQQLMELLPNEHKAKWFAGAALNTTEQSMASVMSTALSRLNAFHDTELEQLLCFDTEIDAETFVLSRPCRLALFGYSYIMYCIEYYPCGGAV